MLHFNRRGLLNVAGSLSIATGLVFAPNLVHAAITLTFSNSTTAGVAGTDFNYSSCNINFLAGREFRMCDPTGNLGGGLPLQKDAMFGGEQWVFNGAGGEMTGVAGTGAVDPLSGPPTGTTYYIDLGAVDPSANRDGATLGLQQGAEFFNAGFNFLAPILGSATVTAGAPHANDIGMGPGKFTKISATTFKIEFDILEAHWAGAHFMLGQDAGAGITFFGTTDGTTFSMWAQHTITASEDKTSAGFSGWTAQWYMGGDIADFDGGTTVIPVPAAVWLLGSGLIGLVGIARRRKVA